MAQARQGATASPSQASNAHPTMNSSQATTLHDIPAEWQAFPASRRWPVLFLGHGSPMNAIEDNGWRQSWQELGKTLLANGEKPRLILCVSAHWITQGWQITGMESPRTIHDFYGFPQELFDQQYPAPGDPASANAIAKGMLDPASGKSIGVDDLEWGFDHGTWSVLKPMFPVADIPVVQLSIDYSRSAEEHYRLGQQLAALRDKGVLIIGSGNVVHNLRAIQRQASDNQAYEWAIDFDQWVAERVSAGDMAGLSSFREQGDAARLSHPTWDHYLPLATISGAVGKNDKPTFFNDRFQAASISMRSMIWS